MKKIRNIAMFFIFIVIFTAPILSQSLTNYATNPDKFSSACECLSVSNLNDFSSDYILNNGGDLIGEWVQYSFDEPKILSHYSISATNIQNRAPNSWVLVASNDEETWTQLDLIENITWDVLDDYETKTFSIFTTTPYKYYRLELIHNTAEQTRILNIGFYMEKDSFFTPINFDFVTTLFFIFITILTLLIGVFINSDFASVLLLIFGMFLFVSQLPLIFPLFYIFIGILFIGWDDNKK